MKNKLKALAENLQGELHFDCALKIMYATDASVYRELPLAVAFPKSTTDIKELVCFATQNKTSLIPRAAGTSLAGQCVGDGIVVDVGKYLTKIIELNLNEGWVKVEPGVVRDELNQYLKYYGFFFAPDTSTSNRCMIGGMAGNNSCGTTSIKYGTTREHVLEMETVLSDGSEHTFRAVNPFEFELLKSGKGRVGKIYSWLDTQLSDPSIQKEIRDKYPKPEVSRRNTGYALDILLQSNFFGAGGQQINLCQLLCGSEGTLAITTALKLRLTALPPPEKGLVAIHCKSVEQALEATVVAMTYQPDKLELMDDVILDCTKSNILYRKKRAFIKGDPGALLMAEFARNSLEELTDVTERLVAKLVGEKYSYHAPVLFNEDEMAGAWQLRKAGLGLLSNIIGDAKPVAVVEDTAVAVEDLPAYIKEFTALLGSHDLKSVYYAHAGAGELHLRPILNLKQKKDRELLKKVAWETAELVQKYKGSNSGEHGDGRVRGAMIPLLFGDKLYELFKDLKRTFDPVGIFNPGKIVEVPPMDTQLRYEENQEVRELATLLDFSLDGGMLRLAEKCNGSGDCRKSYISGGTMCPSYMATRDEKDTTRARANVLRDVLTRSDKPFRQKELLDTLDLCLSCKGCAAECPSNVDMAALKSEVLYQNGKKKGFSFRSKMIADVTRWHRRFERFPGLFNFFQNLGFTKKAMGVAGKRTLPRLAPASLTRWLSERSGRSAPRTPPPSKTAKQKKVALFIDEFTNHLDVEIGKKTVLLLEALGYELLIPKAVESGRAAISKGMLDRAKKLAKENVDIFRFVVESELQLVGIEPSAILTFKDEYPKLLRGEDQKLAEQLASRTMTIEEFLFEEWQQGNIGEDQFTDERSRILLHGHCHQKALTDIGKVVQLLSIPKNFEVELIASGCCGMAGSFGYEKEHYAISQGIGELVLFPRIRESRGEIIAASGTSCRHQIFDGTGKASYHPIEVIFNTLKK